MNKPQKPNDGGHVPASKDKEEGKLPGKKHPKHQVAEIADLLDLTKWDMFEGRCSTKGPLCPYCETLRPAVDLLTQGNAVCSSCSQAFHWFELQSPIGKAWSTWKLPPLPGIDE
jgi:hypothetical protein